MDDQQNQVRTAFYLIGWFISISIPETHPQYLIQQARGEIQRSLGSSGKQLSLGATMFIPIFSFLAYDGTNHSVREPT